MGCKGCELYPSAAEIFRRLDRVLSDFGGWRTGRSKSLYKELVASAYTTIGHPLPGTWRGLSIEPLRERIPPDKLNLEGIDWVIMGGESGRYDCVHPFQLEWARELRDYCQSKGVAFFLKQLGRHPFEGNTPLYLADKHGGDWSEWPEDLRVRQMFSLLQEPTKMSAKNQAQPGGTVW